MLKGDIFPFSQIEFLLKIPVGSLFPLAMQHSSIVCNTEDGMLSSGKNTLPVSVMIVESSGGN